MLLPLLPRAGVISPALSRLKDKRIVIRDHRDRTTVVYDIGDDAFHAGFQPDPSHQYRVFIDLNQLTVSYLNGQSITITVAEDWAKPIFQSGQVLEFYARVPRLWTAAGQAAWLQNAQATGVALLFSGKIASSSHFGDAEKGFGTTYHAHSWVHFARYVPILTPVAPGSSLALPERIYNADKVLDDPVEWRKSIKGASSYLSGVSHTAIAPWAYSLIYHPQRFGLTAEQIEQKLTCGQILKDLFQSQWRRLQLEGVIPDDWDGGAGTGTKPYVDPELDAMDFVPEKITLNEMKFLEAVRYILQRCYPNYSVYVDRGRIWHFTPVLDNLQDTASDPSDILNPNQWAATRLPVVSIPMAEPDGSGRIRGRLITGNAASSTDDRYTAVRIVGANVTEVTEVTNTSGRLLPAWGRSPVEIANSQSAYRASGLGSSEKRHWERGDNGWGVPIYSVSEILHEGDPKGRLKVYFKGGRSELWPHTNDEWNGTTCLILESLASIRGGMSFVSNGYRFTVVDSENVTDIGDGDPGYWVLLDNSTNQLAGSSLTTVVTSGDYAGAHLQLTDDFGFVTTQNQNQLSTTYKLYTIQSDDYTGDLYNDNASTPCNARAVVFNGAQRPNPPANLLEFGQSLGGTQTTMLGRIHSATKPGDGQFWFAGKLIIPFAALRQGKTRYDQSSQGTTRFCEPGKAAEAPEVKVLYERSTTEYREVRAPAYGPGRSDTWAGSAHLLHGVQRELTIIINDFTDESQLPEYTKLARAILQTVSNVEPHGDGWAFHGVPDYLSLIDLHFRLAVDFFRVFAPLQRPPLGIEQSVVTEITYDFGANEVTFNLSTEYNPLGQFSLETLKDAITSVRLLKAAERLRVKRQRALECAQSYQLDRPASGLANPLCDNQVQHSAGPRRGRNPLPVDCHATDGLIIANLGISTPSASDSAGGYEAGSFDADADVTSGMGWYYQPFFDSRGSLFAYDRDGGIQRLANPSLTYGATYQAAMFIDNTDDTWRERPIRASHDMAQFSANVLKHLIGIELPVVPATIYGVVTDYDAGSGKITLRYDTLEVNEYQYGIALWNNGGDGAPFYQIASNTNDSVTLADPGSGFPADIEIGSHIFIVAQRRPVPSPSDFDDPRHTIIAKDSRGSWISVEQDGTISAVSIDDVTAFRPVATLAAGTPTFNTIPSAFLPASSGGDGFLEASLDV